MWRLIALILEALDLDLEAEVFASILDKFPKLAVLYEKAKSAKAKAMIVKKYINMANPEALLRMLRNIPNAKIQQLIRRKMEQNADFRADNANYKSTNRTDQAQAKAVQEDTQITKEYKKNLLNKYKSGTIGKSGKGANINLDKTGETKWIRLSSSWIKFGKYQAGADGIGTLTIRVKSDWSTKWYGPYTYPDVEIELWYAMARARGKNGSGAGTVFWRSYLNDWLGSRLRQIAYEQLHKTAKNEDAKKYLQDKIDAISQSRSILSKEKPKIRLNNIDYRKWHAERSKKFRDIKRSLNSEIRKRIEANREKIFEYRKNIKFRRNQIKVNISKIKQNNNKIKQIKVNKKIYQNSVSIIRNPTAFTNKMLNKPIKKGANTFKKEIKGLFKKNKKRGN